MPALRKSRRGQSQMPRETRQNDSTRRTTRSSRKKNLPPPASSRANKKRASSPERTGVENLVVSCRNGHMIDLYCWVCHELGQEEICSACSRAYHRKCSQKINGFIGYVCPECLLYSVDGTELSQSWTKSQLKELLNFAMIKIFKNYKIFHSWPEHQRNSELVNIFDLEDLIDRIDSEEFYSTPVDFFLDLKGILHNACIVFGVKSEQAKTARKLVAEFKTELVDIEACSECYYNANCSGKTHTDSFVELCSPPHPIMWAKMKGYSEWPAKCLRVVENMAYVKFFGTHDQQFIPLEKCFFMSEFSSARKISRSSYMQAIGDVKKYIANYESMYGKFTYAATRTTFIPEACGMRIYTKARRSEPREVAGEQREIPVFDLSENFSEAEDVVDVKRPIESMIDAFSTQRSTFDMDFTAADEEEDESTSNDPNLLLVQNLHATAGPSSVESPCEINISDEDDAGPSSPASNASMDLTSLIPDFDQFDPDVQKRAFHFINGQFMQIMAMSVSQANLPAIVSETRKRLKRLRLEHTDLQKEIDNVGYQCEVARWRSKATLETINKKLKEAELIVAVLRRSYEERFSQECESDVEDYKEQKREELLNFVAVMSKENAKIEEENCKKKMLMKEMEEEIEMLAAEDET